jgi:hypothetical protein
MLLVKLLKQLANFKEVKRYKTEIKAFGKCFGTQDFKKEQRLS